MNVAVVTGAANGIGLSILKKLLTKNYRVIAVDSDEDALNELHSNQNVSVVSVDVSSGSATHEVLLVADQWGGQIDLLVNNAGIARSKSVSDTDDISLERYVSVNMLAPFRMSREVIARMQKGSSIINIASVAGIRGCHEAAPYAMTKSALIGLTRQMCCDYGPRGIRVNAIAPGLVETALNRDRLENDVRFRELWVSRTPNVRTGRPEDIAEAVAFLSSSKAGFINGHTLVVDGGWSVAHYVKP